VCNRIFERQLCVLVLACATAACVGDRITTADSGVSGLDASMGGAPSPAPVAGNPPSQPPATPRVVSPEPAPSGAAGSSPRVDVIDPADDAGAPVIDAGPVDSPAVTEQPSCTPNAFVSNSFANSVSIIDTNTNKLVVTVPVGTAPVNPTFSLDGKSVYVANSQAGTLSVIDVATNKVTATIPAGGPMPSGLAFLPDGKRLLVTLLGETVTTAGNVVIITLATGEISPPIPVGAQPERLALTPDGQRAYVSHLGDGKMSVIDIATAKVIETITVGDLPFNPLVVPDGSRLYVGTLLSNLINVIDTKTNMIVSKIMTDSPNGMAFSRDYKSLYVTNVFSATVSEVSLETNMVVRTAPAGDTPGFIDVTEDSKKAFFVHPAGTTVDVLDTATLKVIDSITTDMGPTVVAICHKRD
jgi:YVTN family beta-propeller protein